VSIALTSNNGMPNMSQFISMQTFFRGCKAQLVAATAAWCLLAAQSLMAQVPAVIAPDPAEKKLDELETIVIYGGYAIPKMWKVSKGDHVMWVLGDSNAPAGASWRFEQVEARVSESQLVMYPGRAHADIGFFKIIGLITLLPSALKAAKNPDNKTLKDVLPQEVYERWRVLKNEHASRDNDLEKWRPSIALQRLEELIDEKFGVKSRSAQPGSRPPGPALRPLVSGAAKKHKVKVRTLPDVEWKFEVKNVRAMMKFAVGLSLTVDTKCVTKKLEYLERKIEYLKKNANGTGEEKAPPRVAACDETAIMDSKLRSGEIPGSAEFVKMLDDMDLREKLAGQKLDAEWIAAAEAALAKNRSTFAVLPLHQVKNPSGQLAKLRELGYEVEEAGSVIE
jgi:hypothetical protein